MITTIAKRIQSRLSRQDIKVTLGDIKTVCNQMIKDINNSTDAEVNTVFDYFINNATKLVVISEDVTTELDATNEETFSSVGGELGNIAISTQTDLETLEIEQEPTAADNRIQPANSNLNTYLDTNLDSINSQDLHPNTADQDTEILPQSSNQVDHSGCYQPSPLATAPKSELVSSAAQTMGIVLDAAEISLIAKNINHSADDLEQDINAIKSAIMAFVEHKAMVSQQKINNLITEVREVVSEKNQENSQLLTDGLRNINSDIQDANKDFKSNVRTAIKAFAIPAIKAG